MNSKIIQRRNFLGKAGLIAAGAIGAESVSNVIKPSPAEAQTTANWPFPFAELYPDLTAEIGHAEYYNGGCCYGVFKALVSQWAEIVGEPFTHVPVEMMKYGEGGIVGWGSVCGTINGASAAINLVCEHEDAKALINELVAWYSKTSFPIYVPDGQEALTSSVSNSPLCHASVSNWCSASKFGVSSPERKERCARLVADVAGKTTQLLSDHYQNKFVSEHGPAESVSGCMECHGSTSLNNSLGKMDCVSCHEPELHPLPISNWDDM